MSAGTGLSAAIGRGGRDYPFIHSRLCGEYAQASAVEPEAKTPRLYQRSTQMSASNEVGAKRRAMSLAQPVTNRDGQNAESD
jgi:hypothetical protein